MNIKESITQQIKNMELGKIYSYKDIHNYSEHSDAIIEFMDKNIENLGLRKINHELFYKIEISEFGGTMGPMTEDIIEYFTTLNGKTVGYVTGPAIHNWWRLSTQVPAEYTIATSKTYYEKATVSGLRIETIPALYEVTNDNFRFLQFLDVLEEIEFISDDGPEIVMLRLGNRLKKFTSDEVLEIENIAIEGYPERTMAILGLLLEIYINYSSEKLKNSLNPNSEYSLYCSRNWDSAEKNWRLVPGV